MDKDIENESLESMDEEFESTYDSSSDDSTSSTNSNSSPTILMTTHFKTACNYSNDDHLNIFNLPLKEREALFDFEINRINEPQVFKFEEKTGPTIKLKDPVDIFFQFLDKDFFDYVVTKSNEYKQLPRDIKRRKSKKNCVEIPKNTNNPPINLTLNQSENDIQPQNLTIKQSKTDNQTQNLTLKQTETKNQKNNLTLPQNDTNKEKKNKNQTKFLYTKKDGTTYIVTKSSNLLENGRVVKDLTSDEFKLFLGIVITMSLVKKNKLENYWSEDKSGSNAFSKMTRIRFCEILAMLHFEMDSKDVDNHIKIMAQEEKISNKDFDDFSKKINQELMQDSLLKIRWILNYLKLKFKQNYIPSKQICIDESLVRYKGRLKPPLKQYINKKRAQSGFKIFKLCDSNSSYCYNFRFNSKYSKQTKCNGVIKTLALELLSSQESGCYYGPVINKPQFNLLNKGYILYTDNWFTSKYLAYYLLKNNTHLVGTCKDTVWFDSNLAKKVDCLKNKCKVVKSNLKEENESKDNLKIIENSSTNIVLENRFQLKKDESLFSSCKKNNILALKFNDNKCFNLLSTTHTDNSCDEVQNRKKIPSSVLNYRKYMRGVDVHDQYLSYNPLARKYKKFYKKIFFYLIDMTIFNTFVIYNENNQNDSTNKRNNKVSFFAFKKLLADKILNLKNPFVLSKSTTKSKSHYLIRSGNSLKCKNCKTNNNLRKETIYRCALCNVPLCIECFPVYHCYN